MDYYNGYTPKERNRKLRESYKVFPNRSHPYYTGACHMCGDPHSPVEPHSEDYSEPYHWDRPAEYALCKTCHDRLHKRFKSPHAWEAYKRYLRTGGYGSDLKEPRIAREVLNLAKSLESGSDGSTCSLPPLPPSRQPSSRDAWWESLSIRPEALTAAWARPR
jgi:hypothetical protein